MKNEKNMKKWVIVICMLISIQITAQDCHADLSSLSNCSQIKEASGPYAAIAQIKMTRALFWKKYEGVAFLIHPRVLLTAGHNLRKKPFFVNPFSSRVIKIAFHFGSVNKNTSIVDTKVKTKRDENVYYLESFRKHYNNEEDFAVIILPDSSVYQKVQFFFKLGTLEDSIYSVHPQINIAGYPGLKGTSLYRTLWKDSTSGYYLYEDKISKGTCLKYNLFTEHGSSGSPVWYNADAGYSVIGIHTNGFSRRTKQKCNSATIITQAAYNQINEWCKLHSISLY